MPKNIELVYCVVRTDMLKLKSGRKFHLQNLPFSSHQKSKWSMHSMENEEQMEDEKCEVRNFTCVSFPTRSQCTGIAMGGCLTRLQILSMIFSPRVVLFLLVGIAGLTAAALFFSYYWYSISLYSSKNEMFSILGVIL